MSKPFEAVFLRWLAAAERTEKCRKRLVDLFANRQALQADCSFEESVYIALLDYELAQAEEYEVSKIMTQIGYNDWQTCLAG